MPTKNQVIATVLDIARAEIGVREIDDNSGKRVREYQAATTLGGSHWPWCVALTSWSFRQTVKKLGVEIPWSYSASCDVIWADARARDLIRAKPQSGDVGLVRASKRGGYSNSDAIHGFFVDEVVGSSVKTIEGNTNADGGREGVGVMSHIRPISDRYVWVRWAEALNLGEVTLPPWKIIVAGTEVKAFIENGINYVATTDFAKAVGASCTWNAQDNQVYLGGHSLERQAKIIKGRSYFPVNFLAQHLDIAVKPNAATRTAVVG